MIRLRGVSVSFGAASPTVLNGVDLDLQRGEFLSLLGPSGCGKSTVLRVMAGLQAPTAGAVDTTARSPAFVFQEPALMPWASLEDNVALPLRIAGKGREASRLSVDRVLDSVGLTGRGASLPHELSGGMKMRASIARALVTEPDLLLLDEPFAALDDPTRHRLQEDLSSWWREVGFAVCFVTHQVAEAVFLSTRVVVMGAGGSLRAQLEVGEPFPRHEAFRRSVRFHELCVAVADAMQPARPSAGAEP